MDRKVAYAVFVKMIVAVEKDIVAGSGLVTVHQMLSTSLQSNYPPNPSISICAFNQPTLMTKTTGF